MIGKIYLINDKEVSKKGFEYALEEVVELRGRVRAQATLNAQTCTIFGMEYSALQLLQAMDNIHYRELVEHVVNATRNDLYDILEQEKPVYWTDKKFQIFKYNIVEEG